MVERVEKSMLREEKNGKNINCSFGELEKPYINYKEYPFYVLVSLLSKFKSRFVKHGFSFRGNLLNFFIFLLNLELFAEECSN